MFTEATLPALSINGIDVCRLIVGGNPFSGYSHQSPERSREMRDWYTEERIVDTLLEAEELGITTCLSRCDDHITSVMKKYWAAGGKMNWLAQTDSQVDGVVSAKDAADHGAAACFLHGGVVDNCILNGAEDKIAEFVDAVRDLDIAVGIAGHLPLDFTWAEENVSVDFYMVCYYDPFPRKQSPHHDEKAAETYLESDREVRVATIQQLTKPVIHYKIFAAGRNNPEAAFEYTAQQMRPSDAVCVGVFMKDDPSILSANVALFSKYLLSNLAGP